MLCRNRVNDDQLTVTSLQALAKVYKRYHSDIGVFSDMTYILQLLDRVRICDSGLNDSMINELICLVFVTIPSRRID